MLAPDVLLEIASRGHDTTLLAWKVRLMTSLCVLALSQLRSLLKNRHQALGLEG